MPRGKRKRSRLSSSSDEEETASRDSVSLFSNTVTCKRRKRNGEMSKRERQKEEAGREEKTKQNKPSLTEGRASHFQQMMQYSMPHRTVKKQNGRIRRREVINLCIDTNSESEVEGKEVEEEGEEEEEEEKEEKESESEGESSVAQKEVTITSIVTGRRRKPRKKATRTLPPVPLIGGWYTRRGRSRVSHDQERGVAHLKEMFPQHEESFLKSRLEQCSTVEEAIADILATEGRDSYIHIYMYIFKQGPDGTC